MRFAAIVFLLAGALAAQTPEIRLIRVSSGLSNVTEITAPPADGSNSFFALEQAGRIREISNGTPASPPFLDISSKVSCCGERGLLGLAFPPGYALKRYFYVNYTDTQGNTVVSRFRVSAGTGRADPSSEQVLMQVAQPFSNHNGGRIAFGPDGFLYIGLGDGGGAEDPQGNGQRLGTFLGKILRIDTESGQTPYAVPSSNPFVSRAGARPEIWAYGLRNPWKFAFDRLNGDMYIGDVGQGRAEEVDYQPASRGGVNYGWNRTEGLECYPVGSTCSKDGLTLPVVEYTRNLGISVTGGYIYRGNAIPALQGWYLYADFGSGRLWGLRNRNGTWENVLLLSTGLAISTFGEDQAGELYLADYGAGAIHRITGPASAAFSVVNSASFREGVVPGSLATIFGTGIAPIIGLVQATAFPLPTELSGVSVRINDQPVPLLAVASIRGQDQINFQVPFTLAGTASASITVTANGQRGAPVDVPLSAAQPEIFAVLMQPPAWTLWATGLGPVMNPPAAGQPAPPSPLSRTVAETRVTVGGVDAPVFYSGLAPLFAGLYQVNVVPPAGAASNAEVILRVGSAVSQPWRAPVR